MRSKSVATSKTIQGIVIMGLLWLKERAGMDFTEAEAEQYAAAILLVASLGWAVWGRLSAERRVTLFGGDWSRRIGVVAMLGLVLAAGAGCTAFDAPDKRWATSRESLSTTEDLLVQARRQGFITAEDVLEINLYIQSARAALGAAEAQLPDGGDTFEDQMAILSALLNRLNELATEAQRKESDDAGGTGDSRRDRSEPDRDQRFGPHRQDRADGGADYASADATHQGSGRHLRQRLGSGGQGGRGRDSGAVRRRAA